MTNKEFCQDYFQKNKTRLLSTYPGISSDQVTSYFCEFYEANEDEYFFYHRREFFQYLEDKKPLQYIVNNAYFYTSSFYVDERVLIPRSETEILVETISNKIKRDKKRVRLCEVGVGSGAIFLSLVEHAGEYISEVLATDISQDAIDVSEINQRKLSKMLTSKIAYKITDRLDGIQEQFDIIVTNPPYISTDDKSGVHSLVDEHEPDLALYIKESSYDKWFEFFFIQIDACLNSSGTFMMEGHEDKLNQLAKQAAKYFKNINIVKDYTGRDRFLIGEKNG